jgi:hypothetical protein
MSNTATTCLRRADLVPIDTGWLYDELRALGFDAHTAIRSLNYVLSVMTPLARTSPADKPIAIVR